MSMEDKRVFLFDKKVLSDARKEPLKMFIQPFAVTEPSYDEGINFYFLIL
jgi:hypothetical protein